MWSLGHMGGKERASAYFRVIGTVNRECGKMALFRAPKLFDVKYLYFSSVPHITVCTVQLWFSCAGMN
jgi:hypothetical protein